MVQNILVSLSEHYPTAQMFFQAKLKKSFVSVNDIGANVMPGYASLSVLSTSWYPGFSVTSIRGKNPRTDTICLLGIPGTIIFKHISGLDDAPHH